MLDNSKQQLPVKKVLKHILVYFILFLLGELCNSVFFDLLFLVVKLPSEVNILLRSLGCLITTFFFFRLYTVKVLQLKMEDFRININIKMWGIVVAVALPAFVVCTYAIICKLSINEYGPAQTIVLWISSLIMAFKAGLLEEMLFRGYAMQLLESRWNKYIAVLIPSILFSLAHIPSMGYFNVLGILMLVISGTLVGIMFSLITYKGNSISNSVFLHTIWNFFMVTDILQITTTEGVYGNPLFLLIIPSKSVLLSGGRFGVESSLVAIIGYFAVVCWLLISERRSH